MSIKSTFISLLVIVLLAGGAGGVAYKMIEQKKADRNQAILAASQLIKEEQYDEAHQALTTLLAEPIWNSDDSDLRSANIYTLAKMGQADKAREAGRKFLEEFPTGQSAARVRLALGLVEFEEGSPIDAREWFSQVVKDSAAAPNHRLEAELGLARAYMQEYNFKEARPLLEPLYEKDMAEDMKQIVKDLLGQLNIASIFSRAEQSENDIIYHIQPGDTLMDLSFKYGVTMEILQKKNGILKPQGLSVGRRLVIPEFDFSLVVDRYTNTLTVYNHGKFFKEYPVRTGKFEYMTPVGDFSILNKKTNPEWTNPANNERYPGGHPDNQLGSRWMSFQGRMLGIHGTIFPETIGLYTSNGCVGMLKEDVEELAGIIPVGTPLKIQGGRNPEIEKASQPFILPQDRNAPIGV